MLPFYRWTSSLPQSFEGGGALEFLQFFLTISNQQITH
jgi:hypothetical protein